MAVKGSHVIIVGITLLAEARKEVVYYLPSQLLHNVVFKVNAMKVHESNI